MTVRPLVCALAAGAAVLGGCGDDTPQPAGAPVVTTREAAVSAQDDEAIRTAVGRYAVAASTGDAGTACSLLTDRAVQDLAPEAESCQTAIAREPDATLERIGEVTVSGDRATARVTFAAPAPDRKLSLVRDGDAWLIDGVG